MVADAYLQEHARMIRGDILAMAFDVSRAKPLFDQDRARFQQFFSAQAKVRGLSAAMIIEPTPRSSSAPRSRRISRFRCRAPTALRPSTRTTRRSACCSARNSVAAVIKLRGYDNLLSVRHSPARPARCRADVARRGPRSPTSPTCRRGASACSSPSRLMYTVIALAVLLSAVWLGLNFANRLVAPIRRLIGAANIVSTGNLHVQVPVQRSEGDLAQLGETFNKMTYELRTQRDDLVARARPDRPAAALHRGRAGRRQRRRHRRRRRRPHQHPQPLGGETDRSSGGRRHRPSARRCHSGAQGHPDQRPVGHPAPGAGPGDDQPRRAASATSRCGSPPSSRPRPSTATSSRSTTSPIWWRRSAPRPGPTSRAASRTRSRTR